MTRRMTRIASVAGILPLFVVTAAYSESAGNVSQARVLAESSTGENWFLNGGNFRGEHFSPLAQVNDRNVQNLGLAWSLDLEAPDGISGTPIVVDGTVYLSAPRSVVYAIDATSGKVRWAYDPEVYKQYAENPWLSWRGRSNRGVAVWEGKVFVGSPDCRLIALDARTGEEVWSKLTCDPMLGYGTTDAPRVGGGKVFIGNSGSESEEKNRGYVSAYDVDDGKLLWRFFTVPSDDPKENESPAMKMAAATWSGDAWQEFGGGGSAWNEMTYDPDLDLLFFGTGGALPYVYKLRNPEGGDNLFTSSVLAVNASSGEYVWHYQLVPHDSWDYNATMNIVLADLTIDGRRRKVAMIAPKNGFFYVLDRQDGELISAEKFAKVNWATRINLETGRPELDSEASYWDLPFGETVAIWPSMWGAHSWQAMAFHPEHKLVYIPVIDAPQIVTNLADGDFLDTVEVIDEVDGKPHSSGKLLAWDPVTQSERWSVDHELPVNGAVLATAGNLVLQGNAMGDFVAYHSKTGKTLWSVATGTAISAAPVSYLLGDDQHILVPVGVGGGMQFFYPALTADENARGPTRLLAFSLTGKASMPETKVVGRRIATLPAIKIQRDVLDVGAELYYRNCEGCHGQNAVARYGGSVPDLRYASAATHKAWHSIVIGGAKRAGGMPPIALTPEEADAIQSFVLSEAEKLVYNRD